MKQRRNSWCVAAAQMLFVGILILMLALPTLWARAKDAARSQQIVERPQRPGILTEEARRIPSLYMLHSAEQSRYKMERSQQGETQQDIAPIVEEIAAQLTESGVLAQADFEQIQAMLMQPTANFEIERNHFYTAYRLDWWKKQTHLGRIWVLFSTEDRCAVEISVSIAENRTPEEVLQAYSRYLGVDGLLDWVVQDTNTENSVKWYSQTGQATLCCTVENGQLHLSITADDALDNHF